MILNVTQVARTYRTNAMWHSNEEAWKQRGGTFTPPPLDPSSPIASPTDVVPAERYPFGQFAQETAQRLAHLMSTAVRLKQAARTLQVKSEASALDLRRVVISSPKVLTASAAPGASLCDYLIEVMQTARPQMNAGYQLAQHDVTAIPTGSNQMKVMAAGESAPFSIYIVNTDTNQQALQKISQALNQTSLPVKASLVVTDESNGTIQLVLTSTNTGNQGAFTITDVYGSAARISGIDTVLQPTADAVYRINEKEAQTSDTNHTSLDNGKVTVNFNENADTPVVLSVLPDEALLTRKLDQLIIRYNEMHAALTHASGILDAAAVHIALGTGSKLGLGKALLPRLFEEQSLANEGSIQTNTPYLPLDAWEQLGIHQQPDGTLEWNEAVNEQQTSSSFIDLHSSLQEATGVPHQVVSAVNRLLSLPSEQLLDKRKSLYQSFTNYKFRPWGSLRTYLPLPLSGVLVNSFY